MDHNKHRKLIYRRLKKHHPKAVKKAKSLFHFDYPKLLILILAIITAYIIFNNPQISEVTKNLEKFNYLGSFIAGIFLAFGFTAPFSVGFLIVSQPESIILAATIGGIGATIGDLLIFKTIKFSFMNEFEKIKKSETFNRIKKITKKSTHTLIRHYTLYAFAGIFIATPLPDEIGVSLLAGLTTIKPKILAAIAFILHTIAIFIILIASA